MKNSCRALHFIIQYIAAQNSKQRPNLSVSFYGFRSPKLSVSTDINTQRANLLVATGTGSLGGR